jgi:hypothetical protein
VGRAETSSGPRAVRDLPGFRQGTLLPCDDGQVGLEFDDRCLPDPDTALPLGFTVNFYGIGASNLFVNNNGNVTFDEPLYDFRPFDLTQTARRIIAPFFADVDTRGEEVPRVTYGNDVVDGRSAFGVIWDDVGYFSLHTDHLDRFQVVLVERADIEPGDFDIEFNYDRIQWEAGDVQGTGGLAEPGASARAGFSNGQVSLELPGSGTPGAFLDGSPTALCRASFASTQPGRFVFPVRRGRVRACVSGDQDCGDGNPCTVDTCLRRAGQTIGECRSTPAADGTVCDDANVCTEQDACSAGSCVGRRQSCDDGTACTVDTCDPQVGCRHAPVPDGTACDDGDDCSEGEACGVGTCVAAGRFCNVTLPELHGSVPVKERVKVLCEAEQGATCESALFEAVEEQGSGTALTSGGGVAAPAEVVVGQQVSRLLSKQVGKRGRVRLKLKLNRTGRRLLNEHHGDLRVVVRTTIRVATRSAVVTQLLRFVRGRR